jgi:hypothetical protein
MDADQVAPPPGFTLDQPQPTPTPRPGIAQPKVTPPPGFTLDAPQPKQGGIAAPGQSQGGGIAHAVGQWWDQVNPMGIVKAAADFVPREPKDLLVSRPIRDAYNAGKDLVMSGAEDLGAGDTSRGIRKIISGFIPVIGPSLNKAGEQAEQGDYSGAIGTTAGIATNLAAPRIAPLARGIRAIPGAVRQGIAERAYQGALKPPISNPAAAEKMVQTGLREGIPVSRAGLETLGGSVDDLNSQIAGTIQQAGPKRLISPGQAVQNTRDLESQFQNQVNPTSDLDAIAASREDFLNQLRPQGVPGGAVRNLTAEEAQAMKQGTYRQLKDRAYGELKGATVEAQKALARGLKEELVAQFPELADLNAREGSLLQLEPAIEKALARSANREMVGIGGPLLGGAAKVVTGSSGVAGVVGALREVIRYPAVASNLAIAISKGSKGRIPLANARTQVQALAKQLENTSPDESSAPLAGQANP